MELRLAPRTPPLSQQSRPLAAHCVPHHLRPESPQVVVAGVAGVAVAVAIAVGVFAGGFSSHFRAQTANRCLRRLYASVFALADDETRIQLNRCAHHNSARLALPDNCFRRYRAPRLSRCRCRNAQSRQRRSQRPLHPLRLRLRLRLRVLVRLNLHFELARQIGPSQAGDCLEKDRRRKATNRNRARRASR